MSQRKDTTFFQNFDCFWSCLDWSMSIVSPIFILPIIFPNDTNWPMPEVMVKTMNKSSSVSESLGRLFLCKTAYHSDGDWWPAPISWEHSAS